MRTEFLRGNILSTLLSLAVWYLHFTHNWAYPRVFDWLDTRNLIPLFTWCTITLNLFEGYTHIYTGLKYLGFNSHVPPGSRTGQDISMFTMFNVLDILGWECIFIVFRGITPFTALLASAHFGTGIASIFNYRIFDRYYIDHQHDKKYPSERYWRWFKAAFVFTDAITRTLIATFLYALWIMDVCFNI